MLTEMKKRFWQPLMKRGTHFGARFPRCIPTARTKGGAIEDIPPVEILRSAKDAAPRMTTGDKQKPSERIGGLFAIEWVEVARWRRRRRLPSLVPAFRGLP